MTKLSKPFTVFSVPENKDIRITHTNMSGEFIDENRLVHPKHTLTGKPDDIFKCIN